MNKNLSIWFVTTPVMVVGGTGLWTLARLLKSVFGSCRDGILWFVGHLPDLKSATLSVFIVLACFCGVLVCFYIVRVVRAWALVHEAKARKEINSL